MVFFSVSSPFVIPQKTSELNYNYQEIEKLVPASNIYSIVFSVSSQFVVSQ